MNTITLSHEKKLHLIELVISAYASLQAEETSTQAQAIDVSPNTQVEAKATKTKQSPVLPGPLAQNRKFRDQIKALVKSATK